MIQMFTCCQGRKGCTLYVSQTDEWIAYCVCIYVYAAKCIRTFMHCACSYVICHAHIYVIIYVYAIIAQITYVICLPISLRVIYMLKLTYIYIHKSVTCCTSHNEESNAGAFANSCRCGTWATSNRFVGADVKGFTHLFQVGATGYVRHFQRDLLVSGQQCIFFSATRGEG